MEEFVSIPEERMKLLRADPRIVIRIEKLTNAKIKLHEDISIDHKDPIIVYRLKQVFMAFGRGFDSDTALNLLDEDFILNVIHISEFAGKSESRRSVLRARVIGREGKAKKKIEKDCDVKISVYGKTVSVIGKWDGVNLARKSIEKLLSGSEHSSVYRFLEERKTE